jgi:phage portal protein BeeE
VTVVQSEGALVAAMAPWTPNFGSEPGDHDLRRRFSDYAAVYRTQPNVRLVISFLARNIAHLNLKAFRAVSDTERQARSLAHDPLSRLIRSPNPYTTRHRFIDALVHDRKVYDNFFALKVRPPTGRLKLFRIPPYMIEPIGSGWFRPDGWRLIAGTDRPEFPVDAVLHLRGYNPSDARLGHSPIETSADPRRGDRGGGVA